MSHQPVERLLLSGLMHEGVPAFRIIEGRPELVPGCFLPGELEYKYLGPRGGAERNAISTATDVTVARVGAAGMQHQAHDSSDYTMIGAWEARVDLPQLDALQGPCPEATHVARQIVVGAFKGDRSRAIKGGGGVEVANAFGASANHERRKESINTGGDLANCDSATSSDPKPPDKCNEPLFVVLEELQKPKELNYRFEDRVTGARTKDVPLTTDDLDRLARTFEDQLRHDAGLEGLEVGESAVRSATGPRCRVAASTNSSMYVLECFRGNTLVFQDVVEREVLEGTAPRAANSVVGAVDPTKPKKPRAVARRVVILVDVSLSMLVNDETTFLTNDIRRSKRYELVMLLLRGMQENGIRADVSVATFGAAGCIKPVIYKSNKLWALNDDSREHALGQVQQHLAQSEKECIDSTDLAGPLQIAGDLLATPDSRPGKDVVFLITDGAHQAQASNITPQMAAANLRKAGADLTIVRVQLNDLTDLRATLEGDDLPDIVARWRAFYTADVGRVESAWQYWIEDFPAQNNTALLGDVNHIDVSKFYLSTNDTESDPLLMAHEQLLPQVGGLSPVFSDNEVELEVNDESLDGGRSVYTEYEFRAIRGRPFAIRIKKPMCMGELVSAHIRASDHGREKLKVLWEDGAIVTFQDVEIDADDGSLDQRNINNKVTLMIEGQLTGEMKRCELLGRQKPLR